MGSSHFQHFRASVSPKEYSLKWVLLLRVSLQTCKVFRNFSTPCLGPQHAVTGTYVPRRIYQAPPHAADLKMWTFYFWVGFLGPGRLPKWSWGLGRHFDKVSAKTEPPGLHLGICLRFLRPHSGTTSPNVNLYFLKSPLYHPFWLHHPYRLFRLAELVWLNLRKNQIALFKK